MTATAQDFEMWSGDHKNLIYSVTASDGTDLTSVGASIVWTLANDPGAASLVRLTTDSGVTVGGCKFTVALSPAHTSGLAGVFYYEAQMRDSASNISTVAVGNAKINFDVAG